MLFFVFLFVFFPFNKSSRLASLILWKASRWGFIVVPHASRSEAAPGEPQKSEIR